MNAFRDVLLVFASGVMLAGCATSGGANLDEHSTAVTVATELPAPDDRRTTIDFSSYRIGPSDRIAVSVFGADELTREGVVDAAGNFALPLIGTVAAGGKTPEELSALITEKLQGRYVKSPQVAVNIREARSQTFTVDGSVRAPGNYPIIGKLTLQQAIATARGPDEYANINNVVIFRTVNNQKMAARFNLKEIRSGRLADPAIYGSDIIIVGDNPLRRFFKDLTGALPSVGTFAPVI